MKIKNRTKLRREKMRKAIWQDFQYMKLKEATDIQNKIWKIGINRIERLMVRD